MRALFIALLLFLSSLAVHAQQAKRATQPTGPTDQQAPVKPPLMDKATLESYLSRAVTCNELMLMSSYNAQYYNNAPNVCVKLASSYYNPTAYTEDIATMTALKPRFIGRVVGLWTNQGDIFCNYMVRAKTIADDIKASYQNAGLPQPILQAAIYEVATSHIRYVHVNQAVVDAYPGTTLNDKFIDSLMNYDRGSPHIRYWDNDPTQFVPDMSKLETQKWFYFLATQYIDAGYEAIHFGQVEAMNLVDRENGNQGWWNMLSKVREYARSRNRGFVLCDAHTHGQLAYYDADPQNPVPVNSRQLLFDFHSYPIRTITQDEPNKAWGNAGGGGAYLGLVNGCGPIYGKSAPGKTPFGWTTTSLPYLVEFDNWENDPRAPIYVKGMCGAWGYDEISWYSRQTETYRNQWLKYAYYKTQALEPNKNVFLQIPFIRGISGLGLKSLGIYRASNGDSSAGHYSQQDMIARLWSGYYDRDWVHSNTYMPGSARNVVSAGANTFYTSSNGILWVAIYDGSSYTPVPLQNNSSNTSPVIAVANVQNCLATSTDGRFVYYIGVDGEIYGWELINPYTNHRYFKLTSSSLSDKAHSSLVCAKNTHLYFRTVGAKVGGYINIGPFWTNVSPTNNSSAGGTPTPVRGNVIANPSGTALYYQGFDDLIHGFTVNRNQIGYQYFSLPTVGLQTGEEVSPGGQIICPTDDHLYYVGQTNRLHGFFLNTTNGNPSTPAYGGAWNRISPAWSSNLTSNLSEQSKVKAAPGALAASPDGSVLAYIGTDDNLHGFRVLNDWSSEYFDFAPVTAGDFPARDLTFRTNESLLYPASNNSSYKLCEYRLQPQPNAAYNPAIYLIEKPYNYSRAMAANAGGLTADVMSEQLAPTGAATGAAYPNPAATDLYLPVGTTYAELVDQWGRVVVRQRNTSEEKLSVQGCANGLYQLRVVQATGTTSQRIEIRH